MSILNPLLALIEGGHSFEKILLIKKEESLKKVEDCKQKIIDYLVNESKRFSSEAIEVIEIDKEFAGDGEVNELIKIIDDRKPDDGERWFFNAAGGLNYQVVACISALNLDRASIVYPEKGMIRVFELGEREVREAFLAPPGNVDVLELQGIDCKVNGEGKRHWLLAKALKKSGIRQLPRNILEHVTIRSNGSEYDFDLVVNKGNNLSFLKVLVSRKGDNTTKMARELGAIASSRDYFGDLYHREVLVLTNSAFVAERINSETGRSAQALLFRSNTDRRSKECKRFASFIKPGNPPIKTAGGNSQPQWQETGNSVRGDKTLYVMLGEDILPTAISIWSLKPKPARICFLYTPGNELIESYMKATSSSLNLWPTNEVSFYPTGISGREILDIPVKTPMVAAVTPGTKGQGFFLGLLAMRNEGQAYSLDNVRRRLGMIPPEPDKDLKLEAPPINQLVQMKEENLIKDNGVELTKYDHDEAYDILEFIRMIVEEDEDILNVFPLKKVELNNAYYTVRDNQGTIVFQKGHRKCAFSLENSEWFEKLVAHALLESGVEEARIHLKTRWRGNKLRSLMKEAGHYDDCMSEIDIVARTRERFYLVSCKSGENFSVGPAVNEIKAAVPLFGRYARPLLARLKYSGEPNEINGVYMFGYKTLCSPDDLRQLLEHAYAEKQTTKSRRPGSKNA